jgi:hypothetical protein
MSITLKHRRGNTLSHSTFTGALAEITVDTDKNTVVVHNNSSAGGFPLARESAVTTVGSYANSAYIHANAAFAKANTAEGTVGNLAFAHANSSYIHANAAFAAANTANAASGSPIDTFARIQANAAFDRANTGARASASNTAPTGNTVGDLWLSLTDETLYLYSYDGTSNNWVDISGPILRTNEIQIQYTITANAS